MSHLLECYWILNILVADIHLEVEINQEPGHALVFLKQTY